jgi:hypothetical protein
MADPDKKPETFLDWFSRHPCRDGRCEKGKLIKSGNDWINSPCFKKPCDAHLKWINEMPNKGITIGS